MTIPILTIVSFLGLSKKLRAHAPRELAFGESIMRQFLLMSLLLVGAGCQGLRERIDCRHGGYACTTKEPCGPSEKVGAPGPEKLAAPKAEAPKVGAPRQEVAAPAIAQEILLVPRMVYMPYAPQVPTAPMRMGAPGTTVVPPQGAPAPRENVEAPGPVAAPPTKQLVDICEKLCERVERMEKCIADRNASPPTMVCPPEVPYCPPFFRRPLFPRCEPLRQRCEPQPCPPDCMPVPANPRLPKSVPPTD
jgi:hypothetical protein